MMPSHTSIRFNHGLDVHSTSQLVRIAASPTAGRLDLDGGADPPGGHFVRLHDSDAARERESPHHASPGKGSRACIGIRYDRCVKIKTWISGYIGRPVEVRDLIDLAAIESEDPHSFLTAVYQWKYQHLTTAAKALAGAGSAVMLATLVPVIQVDDSSSLNWPSLIVAWGAAAILILIGAGTFSLARRVHSEFVAAQSLLAELVDVRAFVKLYRTEAGL